MADQLTDGASKYRKLLVNNRDLSQVVEKVTWSGDSKLVARKLVFTVASIMSETNLDFSASAVLQRMRACLQNPAN